MNRLAFCCFQGYEDGKMASMQTTGDHEIPVNIFIDNASEMEDAEQGYYYIDVCGVGENIRVFASEEEYREENPDFGVLSLIPVGTFPANPEEEGFEESPHILFSGIVRGVKWNPEAGEEEPNCCILIETLELIITLYLRYDGPVEEGYIAHGIAWLYGDMERE